MTAPTASVTTPTAITTKFGEGDLDGIPAAPADSFSVFVYLAAAIGRSTTQSEANLVPVFTIKFDVVVLDFLFAALANQVRHKSASLWITTNESNDGFKWPAGFLCSDVVASFVVLIPKTRARVLLLVPVFDQPFTPSGTSVLRHPAPSLFADCHIKFT